MEDAVNVSGLRPKKLNLDISGNFEIKSISRYIFLLLIYGSQKNVYNLFQVN